MIKLIGILIIGIGFAFRLNTLAAVFAAGIVTGLVAGFSFNEVMAMTGELFVANRGLTLPILLMVPVVGLLEKHGLQERVASLMRSAKAATPGRVMWMYQIVREATSVIGLSIGNHASMIRPLIAPMAEGAHQAKHGSVGNEERAKIRAHAAASENAGNFFADDILVAVGALLLIYGFFESVGVEVALRDIKLWSLPTALWVIAVGWWRYRVLDRRLAALAARAESDSGKGSDSRSGEVRP